jgi:hypothetical protein
MPKYRPSPEDEELYGGPVKPPGGKPDAAPAQDPPPKPGEEPREPETTDEEAAESMNSAVVSNKVLAGPDGKMPQEGEEVLVKIVKSYGDEVEICRVSDKPTGPDEGPMSSDSELEAMDQPME